MGLYKHNGDGNLQIISGRGKAEYGASTLRKGTLTVPVNQATGGIFIEFDTPLPDNDYIVSWEFDDCADGDAAHLVGPHYKYATGFGLYYFGGFTKDVRIKWTAFKLYTDNEYNNILASMPSNASASNKLMAEDEFVVVTANLRSESLPAGIGELYKDIPVPTGYSPFCIVDYDLGRLQGLNITGMSLAATVGQVRIATYCDRAITNELNGGIRVMCRKN